MKTKTNPPSVRVTSAATVAPQSQHHGEWLRQLREEAKLNQTELGRRMGVTQGNVSRNEKRPILSTTYVISVLTALGLELVMSAKRRTGEAPRAKS